MAAALAFGIVAFASIELTRGDGRIAAVWIPNALAVVFMLRVRLAREWLFLGSLFAGNVLANVFAGDDAWHAIGLAACNLAEILIAVHLSRRFCGMRPDMEDIGQLSRFVGAAAIAAPFASATLAMAILGGDGPASLVLWLKWAVTDGLGMIIIAPASLIIVDSWRRRRWPSRREAIEWSILTIAGTTMTVAVFAQTEFPLLFLTGLVVLSHAFRLGALGTAFSVTKVASIATVFTSLELGPINLIQHSDSAEIVVLQGFIAAAFLMGLPVAAILSGRNRLIQEIEQSRRELALLADNITDAVLRFDLDGVCTYASPSVGEVLGEPAAAFRGTRASDRAHPDAIDRISEAEERLLSGEAEKQRFTYRRLLDDPHGKPVYIEADCAIARAPATGEAEGIVVSARDVTARVELELQLVRARRHAEDAAHAKSQFLANMSHEIRTPMNGVLGFAELLLQEPLEGKQRRHAELIVQSGRSMMLLLNDILDLSKIEAGQIVIEQSPVDIVRLIDECVALQMAAAEGKGLELEVDAGSDECWSVTDALRLRQIVLNLIGNAIKFTMQGSIQVSIETGDGRLEISVRDTGIGIPEDRLEDIFTPFEQGDSNTDRKYGGTGLGLSISRQLAELLGGSLGVTSREGIGTEFTICLPLVETAAPAIDSVPKGEPESTDLPEKARILLVEDHDVNRLLVTEMLERCDQQVNVAHDGNAAISMVLDAHARGEPFALVLMDVQMPDCDGYSATRAIRAEGIGPATLPIIALTANAFPEDIAAARDSGMQGHLAKPLVFAELVATLQRWLPTTIVEDDRSAATVLPDDLPRAVPRRHSDKILATWQERRREAIDAVAQALRSGSLTGVDGEDLARLVHKLAGTAGMFGEDRLGECAAAFERALRSEVDPEVREELARDLLEAA
ncbi:sensor histidine kinase /response regulator [Altererythrobacter epoxidivorans]|uniref:histidine kinase n=1 Tax=Altererythrobacter epoxidivorans TaxID=361183 RepID=A0A0M4LW53_9SPHN|nr:sensor histidine kinase /response regulator [Altererythrobacter epoxidivorans]